MNYCSTTTLLTNDSVVIPGSLEHVVHIMCTLHVHECNAFTVLQSIGLHV
jgi:hypothetical protein